MTLTRISSDELSGQGDDTDWDRLEQMTDEEIREAAEADPDQELLDENWFKNATLIDSSTQHTDL